MLFHMLLKRQECLPTICLRMAIVTMKDENVRYWMKNGFPATVFVVKNALGRNLKQKANKVFSFSLLLYLMAVSLSQNVEKLSYGYYY